MSMKKMAVFICVYLCLFSLIFGIEAKNITSKVLLKTESCWNGEKLPNLDIKNPEVTVVRIKIPPKEELPIHKHKLLNVAYLVKGTLKVTTKSGENILLRANDVIAEVIDRWHSGKNIGEDEVEIIVFYVGERGTHLYEKESEELKCRGK